MKTNEEKKAFYKRKWQREKERMANDPEYAERRKAVQKASFKKWRETHKEEHKAYMQEWWFKNKDKYNAKMRKYQRTHRDKMRLLEARYRATHREQCRERLQRWRMARKQEREQIQALQATLAELMGRLSTLEHTRVQNERQRLQWGWDIQQVRIKLRRTRGEIERLSAKTRRRS